MLSSWLIRRNEVGEMTKLSCSVLVHHLLHPKMLNGCIITIHAYCVTVSILRGIIIYYDVNDGNMRYDSIPKEVVACRG